MARKRDAANEEEHPAIIAKQLEPKRGEVWWYRQGAYLATAIVAVAIWFVMIGPKERSPKADMVEPATDVLTTGVKKPEDSSALSKELHFKVLPPDLKQLGGKLNRVSKAEFGGQQAAVFDYQYGKSEFLLYRFIEPSNEFKDMKKVHAAKNLFYISSSGPTTVVAWKDRRSGYYALAAKATEKDLITLAGKMVWAF
jgi:hypothetical protein